MIEAYNLVKTFGKIRAVDGLNFSVEEGQIVALLGPNGAGKTTAMRILTGFLTPDSGSVKIDGLDLLKQARKIQSKIGYLPEDVPLYTDMTVNSFLSFVARVKGLSWKKKQQAVAEVVEQCRLGEVRNRVISKLSKGFRQRVGIAQALIGNPKILILDEPTSGLDPKQINEIRQLIHSFKGKQTIFISTHILPEASAIADRVLIINHGKLAATGTPHELAERLRSNREILLSLRPGKKEVLPVLSKITGVTSIEQLENQEGAERFRLYCEKGIDLRPEIARVLVRNDFEIVELRSERMSLEDIFIKLVTEDPVQAAETQSVTAIP